MPLSATSQQVVDEARALCVIAAPPFAEAERAAAFAEQLTAAAGVPARIDDTGNVIATLPARASGEEPPAARAPAADTDPAALPVAFAAHLDTVFPAGTDLTLREEPGRLIGPGIGDNTLGVAALLHLARHLAGRPLTRPVLLVGTVGEEGLGDLRGAKALLRDEPLWGFVAVAGAMLGSLTTGGTGSIRLRVTVHGPGGHPLSDRDRPSAIHGLLEGLVAVELGLPEVVATVGGEAPADLIFNIGTLRGGSAINVIASEATAELDLRSDDEAVLAAAAAAVRAVFGNLAAEPPGLTVTIDDLGHRPAGAIDPAHPLLTAARRARELAGLPPAEEGRSSTDANAAHGLGVPAITVGITTGGGAHTSADHIDLAPIDDGLAALTALADELTT